MTDSTGKPPSPPKPPPPAASGLQPALPGKDRSPISFERTMHSDVRGLRKSASMPQIAKPRIPTHSMARTAADDGTAEWNEFDFGESTQTVHQYELIRELGRGGMGVVHLARDTRLGRRVAIKFLTTPDKAKQARFLIEARTTASLQHENIVVIHEVNTHDDNLFMVLELLEGQPLADLVEDRRIHPLRAIEWMIPVVRALIAAHAAGVVHRDLKPDNVFVTSSGTVKVLDFGIAKLLGLDEESRRPNASAMESVREVYATISNGTLVGTVPYMSPEQWGMGPVDHRTDLYAAGIMLFEMVTGEHPVRELTIDGVMREAMTIDTPLRSVRQVRGDVPDGLAQIIDRCISKHPERRYASAEALLADLEAVAPQRFGRAFVEGENPYPGLLAFQENDAGRFFGRQRDVAHGVALLNVMPLLAVVGPSGVGKSSYVRAGLMPGLKATGQPWQALSMRPGRKPIDSLASLLLPLLPITETSSETDPHGALVTRLHAEPGLLGVTLRSRARESKTRYALFVDQFEELYTLVPDARERGTFTRCLLSVADDAASPLRLILSMRSDLLDRAAESHDLMAELARGLLFLNPLDADGLHEALTRPAELAGYRFESEALVRTMMSALDDAPGALPLLQFAASRLWERRDQQDKRLTQSAHDEMGGVSGTLASHADEVLRAMAQPMVQVTRSVFQRLVTAEGTRAIVDESELIDLGTDRDELRRLLHLLADARLLVLQAGQDGGGSTVEIVHESLVTSWPTLRRWLEASHEDSAFLRQLTDAARQWDSRERSQGLLWRGDAADEALRFHTRLQRGTASALLTTRERDYLEAVYRLATRATRIRRGLTLGALIFLSALVAAAAVALVTIREAERKATHHAEVAEAEARRALSAESEIKAQLQVIQQEQRARMQAEAEALEAIRTAALTREQLEEAFAKLRVHWMVLRREAEARAKAERAAAAANARAIDTAALAEAHAAAAAEVVSEAQAEAEQAHATAEEAKAAAAMTREELERALAAAQTSLAEARQARTAAEAERTKARQAEQRAQEAATAAKRSEARIEELLEVERAHARKLQQARSKIATELR